MRNVKINFRQVAIGIIASFFVVSSVGAIVGAQNFAYDYIGAVDYSKDPQFLAQGDVEVNGDLFVNNDKSFFSILPGKGAFLTLKNAALDSFSIGNDSGSFSILNKDSDPVLKLDQVAGLMNIFGPLKLVADGLHTFEIKNGASGVELLYTGNSDDDTFEFRNSGTGGFAWGKTGVGLVKLNKDGLLTAPSISGDGSGLTALKWLNITGRPLVDNNSVDYYSAVVPIIQELKTSTEEQQNFEFKFDSALLDTSVLGNPPAQLLNKVHRHNWDTHSSSMPIPSWERKFDPSFKLYCPVTQAEVITQDCGQNHDPNPVTNPTNYECNNTACVDNPTEQVIDDIPCPDPRDALGESSYTNEDGSSGFSYKCRVHDWSRRCDFIGIDGNQSFYTGIPAGCSALGFLGQNLGYSCSNDKTSYDHCTKSGYTPTYTVNATSWQNIANSNDDQLHGFECPSNQVACGIRGTDPNTSDAKFDILCCTIRFIEN